MYMQSYIMLKQYIPPSDINTMLCFGLFLIVAFYLSSCNAYCSCRLQGDFIGIGEIMWLV